MNVTNIENSLSYLKTTKTLIKEAIINKGQNITNNTPFRNYVEKIENITAGGTEEANYIFNYVENMTAFSDQANDNDFAMVYVNASFPLNTTGWYNHNLMCAESFTLSRAPGNKNYSNTNIFSANVLSYSISNTRIDLYLKSKQTTYQGPIYQSTDGLYYNLYPGSGNSSLDFLLTQNVNVQNFVEELGYIISVKGDLNYNGIYSFDKTNNQWNKCNTQLNITNDNIINGFLAFGNEQKIGTFGNNINVMNNTQVKSYTANIQPLYTNIKVTENYMNYSNFLPSAGNIFYLPITVKGNNMYRAFYSWGNLQQVNVDIISNSNMSYTFYGCYNLQIVNSEQPIILNENDTNTFSSCYNLVDLPKVKIYNMVNGTFTSCNNIYSVENIDISNVTKIINGFSYWGTQRLNKMNFSNVDTIQGIFRYFDPSVSTYTQFDNRDYNLQNVQTLNFAKIKNLDSLYIYSNITSIPNYNLPNLESAAYMFSQCNNLASVPNFKWVNCKNATHLFYYVNSLSKVNINLPNLEDGSAMFYGLSNLTAVNMLGRLNNLKDISSMFRFCNNLTTLNINISETNVTNTAFMFENCSNLVNINIPSELPNCLSTSYMYTNCLKWNKVNASFNLPLCLNAYAMFYQCSNLKGSININAPKLKDAYDMFYNCIGINKLNINIPKATNLGYIIRYCNNLSLNNVNIYAPEATDISWLCADKSESIIPFISNICKGINYENITNMYGLFYNCQNLTTIVGAENINTIKLNNTAYMFYNCQNLSEIFEFNTDEVTNMYCMFYNCRKISNVPNVNTSKATQMYCMFENCINIKNFENINTSNATNIARMFAFCTNLKDAPSLNTEKATSLYAMYNHCYNLVNVPEYNSSKVTTMANMVSECNNLSDASIQNIINMCLNSNIVNGSSYKNLMINNALGPFYNTNITSDRYSNRLEELANAGWTY